jgi:hypothetical protein
VLFAMAVRTEHPALSNLVAQAFQARALLCDDCAADHEHDEEMFLPVVNSPRIGMCGYSG